MSDTTPILLGRPGGGTIIADAPVHHRFSYRRHDWAVTSTDQSFGVDPPQFDDSLYSVTHVVTGRAVPLIQERSISSAKEKLRAYMDSKSDEEIARVIGSCAPLPHLVDCPHCNGTGKVQHAAAEAPHA